jgi:A/G-specific adenine glycosylase
MTPTLNEAWTRRLLRWYRRHRRALPWRRRAAPYAVWVSEVMLQQTQVKTVIPYFNRFMARFPSPRALARARLHDVLRVWEGLGYYARARNLHSAARRLAAHHSGRLPTTSRALRRLPGIGEYSAAAIASICHGEPVPAVDGNVVRVLARFLGLRVPGGASGLRRRVRAFLLPRIPRAHPGDFNQALMELGALVCRPHDPACARCPLGRPCVARRSGRTEFYRPRRAVRTVPHRALGAGVVLRDRRVLVVRRNPDRMLGCLWDFPGGTCRPRETLPAAARRHVLAESGLRVETGARLCVITHAYSHFRITLHAFLCRPRPGQRPARRRAGVRWLRVSQLNSFPFSAAARRVALALEAHLPAQRRYRRPGTKM